MKSPNDLWEEIGSLQDEEFPHVLTKLFAYYEMRLQRNPRDDQALLFFRNLTNAQLEGEYLFPLPEGAAVSRFAMTMGGNWSRAR